MEWMKDFYRAQSTEEFAKQVENDFRLFCKSHDIERFVGFFIWENPDGTTDETKLLATLIPDKKPGNLGIICSLYTGLKNHIHQLIEHDGNWKIEKVS